jgi:hypothetical protein
VDLVRVVQDSREQIRLRTLIDGAALDEPTVSSGPSWAGCRGAHQRASSGWPRVAASLAEIHPLVRRWPGTHHRAVLDTAGRIEFEAGLLLLIAVAAGAADHDTIIVRTLNAIGWMRGDGSPLGGFDACSAAWDTWAMLRRLGALTGDWIRRDERPTPDGVTFARAVLHAWP